MQFPFNKPGASPKKFSRGKFLRDSVITASGVVLLPSIFSSCVKFGLGPGSGPGKGWGGVPSQTDMQKAAANLILLRQWLTDVYSICAEYELVIFDLLGSSKDDNADWNNFIGNLFIDIAVGITGAVAEANPGSQSQPALACLCDFLKDWNAGQGNPPYLVSTFNKISDGQLYTRAAIEEKLNALADPANNYSNLLTQWQDVIEFNGKSYTLSDLADSSFPELGDLYNKLQNDAFTHYKKSLWNLVIMKCCSYYENYHQGIRVSNTPRGQFYTYIQETFYPQNKGVYVRCGTSADHGDGTATWQLIYYNLGIGGYAIPDAAAAELFIDDSPGHVINPSGLWNRSYVFKQFSVTKYEFLGRELAGYPNNGNNYNTSDSYEFTGGLFPRLMQ